MAIAQNVAARVARKFYASGVMASNAQAVSASDLGASGAQILRRVSSTLKLGIDTYTSAEINAHRQVSDFRHGTKRATGGIINGEFSPGTYWDDFEATLRCTAASAVTASESDFTNVTATGSTFVFGAGDPHAKGFRVGSIVQFGSLSEALNNSKNFLIVAMGGTTNRTLTVYPTPTAMSADTAFTVAEIGQSMFPPESSQVERKAAIEHYFQDVSFARLFTEVRYDGFNLQLPATGIAKIDFTGMGRDMEVYEESDAPFFTSPTAASSTGLAAAVNGALYFQGSKVGLCTGLNIQAALGASSDAVVGQNFVPEVFLSTLNVTGTATIMLEDATFINYFKNETEVAIVGYLTSNNADASPAASFVMGRVKLGDADSPLQGNAGIIQSCPFRALKYQTAGSGFDAATIRLHDTQAS